MQSQLKILIVEDVPTDAELALRELKKAGLAPQVVRVETRADYLRQLDEFAPDIILSDFTLPNFDGLSALRLARDKCPDTPFIFVSGTIGEEVAIEALKRGAADYVLKTNLKRLGPAVERALQDVEERRARLTAERQLNEARIRFELFMRHLPGAAFIKDPQGRYQFVNWSWEEIRGRKMAEVLGRTDGNLWPELAAQLENNERLVIDRNDALRSIETFPLPDGVHHYLVHKFPIRDRNGQPVLVGGIAIDYTDRLRAEEKVARLSRIHAVLSGINSLIVRVRDRQELFNEACRIAVEDGQFPFAWIGVLDPATQDVTAIAWAGESSEELTRTKSSARDDTPRGKGAVGRAIRERRPVSSNDIALSGLGGPRLKEILRLGFRSQITLPLFEDQTVVGTLTMYAREPNFFDEKELSLLTDLAGDISFALEHIGKEGKIARLSRIEAVTSSVNTLIVRVSDRQELFDGACRIAVENGGFGMAWIGTLNPETLEITPVAWSGIDTESMARIPNTARAEMPPGRGLLGRAVRDKRVAFSNDMTMDSEVGGERRQEAIRRGYRSAVALPLLVDGAVVGTLSLFAIERGFFNDDELKLLSELAGDISFALAHISKEEKLNYLAYYDVLTGLPNRTLIHDRLTHAIQSVKQNTGKVAVLLCDIKRFHHINDTLGRHAGDAMLREFAQRLGRLWPEPDHVARISADCFAGVLSGIKEAPEIAHLLEKPFTEALSSPFVVGGKELMVSITAGVALFPTDGEDADTLLKNAEAALKKAKAGGEKYLFYHPKMNAAVAETLALENKMRRAIEQEQFTLHYQPKVDLAKGHISGLEGLIRWNDPETGLVPPGKFIPLLEETGMILDVGVWAIRKAILDRREWAANGLRPPRVAVNVSAIQLRQKDFVGIVKRAIEDRGQEPGGLDLEITESLIMENIEDNIIKLAAIRDMGIGVVIDDFGTGYSSLSYIAKLPISALKIDRAFVMNVASSSDSMAIVSTIISLAHSLNLEVVAEGVETEEQRNLLRLLKCDSMQGFLFSKSLPAAEIVAKLKSGEWKS